MLFDFSLINSYSHIVASFSPPCLLKENQDLWGFSDVFWLVPAFKILLMETYLSIVKKKKLTEHWFSKFFKTVLKTLKVHVITCWATHFSHILAQNWPSSISLTFILLSEHTGLPGTLGPCAHWSLFLEHSSSDSLHQMWLLDGTLPDRPILSYNSHSTLWFSLIHVSPSNIPCMLRMCYICCCSPHSIQQIPSLL